MTTNMSDRYDRIRACVLGAAIGDALGAPNEFTKKRRYSTQLYDAYDGKWTDDTQLSMALADAYTEANGNPIVDDLFVDRLCEWSVKPRGGHRAPGNACLAAAAGYIQDLSWHPPKDALGSGAVMRAHIHGCVLPTTAAHDAAHEEAQTTHGLQAAKAAATWAGFISKVIRHATPNELRGYEPKLTENAPNSRSLKPNLHGYEIANVFDEHQGWTSTSALTACMTVFKNTDSSIRWDLVSIAAGSSGDSDTLGSMMGAVMGAAYGMAVIPQELLAPLEDRPWLEAMAKKLFALSVIEEAERE